MLQLILIVLAILYLVGYEVGKVIAILTIIDGSLIIIIKCIKRYLDGDWYL